MAAEKSSRFPSAQEVEIPAELEGWEDMYPSHYLFGGEGRKEWREGSGREGVKASMGDPETGASLEKERIFALLHDLRKKRIALERARMKADREGQKGNDW